MLNLILSFVILALVLDRLLTNSQVKARINLLEQDIELITSSLRHAVTTNVTQIVERVSNLEKSHVQLQAQLTPPSVSLNADGTTTTGAAAPGTAAVTAGSTAN